MSSSSWASTSSARLSVPVPALLPSRAATRARFVAGRGAGSQGCGGRVGVWGIAGKVHGRRRAASARAIACVRSTRPLFAPAPTYVT